MRQLSASRCNDLPVLQMTFVESISALTSAWDVSTDNPVKSVDNISVDDLRESVNLFMVCLSVCLLGLEF